VRISWNRHLDDAANYGYNIINYSIWRKIDYSMFFKKSEADSIVKDWDIVISSPAVQSDIYNAVVPTFKDSTKVSGQYYSYFRVMAHTDTAHIFFISPIDSGYSVDNLFPAAPQNIIVEYIINGNLIKWQENTDSDFNFYAIHRAENANYEIDSSNRIGFSTINEYLDSTAVLGGKYYYKIATYDYSGNYSISTIEVVTNIDNNVITPQTFHLSQNYPNPFNQETKIQYTIARPTTVKLEILNVFGQRIKTLINQQHSPGLYTVKWDGRNDQGVNVSSGIYIYKLVVGSDFVMSRKMILMK